MTVTLPAGFVLTIVAAANAGGSVRQLAPSGSATIYAAASISASTTTVLGPFSQPRQYDILSDPGQLTYTIAAADVAVGRPARTDASVSGAITPADGTVVITKAGIAVMTLAAPTLAQDMMIMRIVSNTANAHTVTATGLFEDGVTGGAKDVATFAAFAGASMTIQAVNLKWSVLGLNAVTVAAA